jgi:serine/threonine protein kinase
LLDRRRSVSVETIRNELPEPTTTNITRSRSGSVDELRSEISRFTHLQGNDAWLIQHSELEFTEKIGVGGGGKVYKGILRSIHPVAIKVLKQLTEGKLLDEFKKEVEIMSSIRAKEIVHFFGMCFEPKLCIVMEYCGRGSLYHVLNNPSLEIGWDKVIKFAVQMAKGMDCLHSWKPQIVHRDMKSLNLLVSDDWNLKVGDFGLSRFTTADNMETLTKLRGTPLYCAPVICFLDKF